MQVGAHLAHPHPCLQRRKRSPGHPEVSASSGSLLQSGHRLPLQAQGSDEGQVPAAPPRTHGVTEGLWANWASEQRDRPSEEFAGSRESW